LRDQGQFDEALAAMRRGHELGSRRPDWNLESARWLRELERLAELNRKLPALLAGKAQPASAAEAVELVEVCHLSGRNRAAAQFSADAFARDPKLAEDLEAGHRYDAACYAALAAAGQGKDAALDSEEKARWRRRALEWLQADLERHRRRLRGKDEKAAAASRATLQHWQEDSDLAGVRDEGSLARLPEDERQSWRQLWTEVARLLEPSPPAPP
jgi:hypothetical protein